MIRLDPGYGDGHHEYVVTGGVQSKFGVSLLDIDYLAHLVQSINTKGFIIIVIYFYYYYLTTFYYYLSFIYYNYNYNNNLIILKRRD